MVLEGPCTRDTPCGGRERGATGAFGRGVVATPLPNTQNCGMSRDRGVATPWSATGGVCVASAPLSLSSSVFCARGSHDCLRVAPLKNEIAPKSFVTRSRPQS